MFTDRLICPVNSFIEISTGTFDEILVAGFSERNCISRVEENSENSNVCVPINPELQDNYTGPPEQIFN